MRTLFSVIFILFLSLSSVQAGENISTSRISFTSFDTTRAGDYAYLGNAVKSMLTTRLSGKADLSFVDSDAKTDFLVTGDLASDGKRLRISLVFFDSVNGGTPQEFTIVAEDPSLIVAAVEKLSQDVAVAFFGYEKPKEISMDKMVISDTPTPYYAPHPEKIFKQALLTSSNDQGETKSIATTSIRKSPKFDIGVVSMDVGNADGLEGDEIVIASIGSVKIINNQDKFFKELTTILLPEEVRIHQVNLADLNNNGRAEIYISATKGYMPSSWVMEFDDNGKFGYLYKDVQAYLRPVVQIDGSIVLAGQKGETDNFFASSVYEMDLTTSNSVNFKKDLLLPEGVNIFDFSYIDLDNDGRREIIAVDSQNKLNLYDEQDKLIWQSTGDYCSSSTYMGPPLSARNDNEDKPFVYSPSKIIIKDVNKDGKADILVAQNNLLTSKYMSRTRLFEGGIAMALSWNGTTMEELWRTTSSDNYIADIQYVAGKDANNFYIANTMETMIFGIPIPGGGSRVSVYLTKD